MEKVKFNEVHALKVLIEKFIQERLQAKLDKAKNEDEREKLRKTYEIENWIGDAARRVDQIQMVTHAVKFQNPDAQGTSIYLEHNPNSESLSFISTHSLTERQVDIVGNAAVLDVPKFLALTHKGRTLLERAQNNDAALRAALPGSEQQKTEWLTAFAGIVDAKGTPATHTLAKQIYFPINDSYHLIAPLFPTSLVQAVFEQIQTRFDEKTKAARIAKKNNEFFPHGYREYTQLAVQSFGGSKPQNISQLNSTRGGKSYLLSSLPPQWKKQGLKPPLNIKSIFDKLGYRPSIREPLKILRKFLHKTDHNNIDIRDRRAYLVQQICDQLLNYAAQIQQLPSGWSAAPHCKLNEMQAFWLDTGRAKVDEEWVALRESCDWKERICHDFAIWFNAVLKTEKLIFGDSEYAAWKEILRKELSMLREAL